MDLGKGYFKGIFNKLNTTDLILNSILSFCISVFLFYLFLSHQVYTNLTDFFTGETIYANYHKYCDIKFVFLYSIIWFVFSAIYSKLKAYVFEPKIEATKKNKKLFYTIQYILLLGYLSLYPFDGHLYPILATGITILIVLGVFDIKRKQALTDKDGSIHFSFFSVIAIALLCFGRHYELNQVFVDPHHDAEHLTAFFMHAKFNMEYYKDIMLVHGYRDLVESWLGLHIFGQDNLYTFFLGETLYYNLLVLVFSALSIFVFDCSIAAIIPIISLYRNDDLVILFGIYLMVFLILLKDSIFKNDKLFLSLYILFAFLFSKYWTTMGVLWSISILPIAIFKLWKTIKTKEYKNLTIPFSLFLVLFAINAKEIYYFLIQANYYIKGNLYGFGTIMPYIDTASAAIYYKMFAVLIAPILLVLTIKEFSKENKNSHLINIYQTIFILIFISLSYAFGRTDKDIYSFNRLLMLSLNLIFIFIPYLLYKSKKNEKALKYAAFIAIFFLVSATAQNLLEHGIFKKPANQQTQKIPKQGLLNIQDKEKTSLYEITDFIKSNLKPNDTFLDLTNEGILYYLLDKKTLLPYTSYYNIVSQEQAKYALSLIKGKEPDVIYMDNISAKLDNVYPSLRINPIYRHIILSKQYKLVTEKNKALLIKTTDKKEQSFSEQDKLILDTMLSNSNLQQLPDAWGQSIKTLPIQEIYFDYLIQKVALQNETIINIHFNKPIKGCDIDLIYMQIPINKEINIAIQPNSGGSVLSFNSRTGKMLIPFDNYPSWLLSENITDITIRINAIVENPQKINFYKRK